ncbi:MAG: hypothetical protein Q9225_006229 [Loekoesia sp. 1 TL-2023]
MAGTTPGSPRARHNGTPDLNRKRNGCRGGDFDTPSPKRHRTARASTSGKSMSYDMKYHPMDDVLRPAASAARKAAHGLDTRRSSTTSESTTLVEGSDNSDETEDTKSLRPSPKASIPATEPFASPPHRPIPPRSGSPSGRRVTRAEINGEKPVLYDMKHHPMDLVTRPAAAKRVLQKWSTASHGSPPNYDSTKSRLPQSMKAKHKTPALTDRISASPSTSNMVQRSDNTSSSHLPPATTHAPVTGEAVAGPLKQSPTREPATSVWKSLLKSERLMYLLQKGAPNSSSTLCISWNEVACRLKARFDISDYSFHINGLIAAVQARYACIHQELRDDFDAEPEPTEKEDWTLHYAEDFDVYDYEVGDKYFKYRGNSVVQPTVQQTCGWTVRQQDVNSRLQIQNEAAGDRPNVIPSGTSTAGETQVRHQCANSKREDNGQIGGEDEGRGLILDNNTVKRTQRNRLVAEEEAGVQHHPEADSDTTDNEGGRSLNGSYNDAEGYIQQVQGRYDDDFSTQESPEKELIASMRNDISANIDDVLDIAQLTPLFPSSPGPAGDNNSGREELKRPLSRRSRNRAAGSNFSVHEDEPGSTPRIKKQVAMNPRSPGTDIPKENLQERSLPEEQQSGGPII